MERTSFVNKLTAFLLFVVTLFSVGVTSARLGVTGPVVKKYQETMDLWTALKDNWILPGYYNAFTNTPPTNGWLNYLEKHGSAAVTKS